MTTMTTTKTAKPRSSLNLSRETLQRLDMASWAVRPANIGQDSTGGSDTCNGCPTELFEPRR